MVFLCCSTVCFFIFFQFSLWVRALEGRVFAHVSDHRHPAPWVVAGSLPSWERLFFLLSPLFIYLLWWWWWCCWCCWCCWWFLLSCIYVKSLFVAVERSQHVAPEPSQIRVSLVKFLYVSSLHFWWLVFLPMSMLFLIQTVQIIFTYQFLDNH